MTYSKEQLEKNIKGLYAPMIYQTIKYSQIAIDKLDLSPEVVYSQRFDRRKFIEVGNAIYTESMAQGLSKHSPLDKDAFSKVGSFLEFKDIANVVKTSSSAASALKGAKKEYNLLNSKNIASNDGGNDKVDSDNTN